MADNLKLDDINNQDEFICINAVRQNGMALQYVKNKTIKICLEALANNKLSIQFIKLSDINKFDVNFVLESNKKTLLMYAVEDNNADLVENILLKKVNIYMLDENNNCARNYAINNRFWYINKLLMQQEDKDSQKIIMYNNFIHNNYKNKNDNDKENYSTCNSIPGSTGLNGYKVSSFGNAYIGSCSNCNVSSYSMNSYK